MDARISIITLGVSNLERSKAFYEDVFGWRAEDSPPEIAFFNLGGIVFSLYPNVELAKDYGGTTDDSGHGGFALAHNLRSVEEVDTLFAQLRSKGAAIIKEPEQVFWGGYSGYVADPDGHKWEIAYNPFWTILEDGRISMTPPED